VKASFFPNSAALVLIALALGSLLMGQPYSRARADAPPPNLDATPYDLLIANARKVIDARGQVLAPGVALIGSLQTQSMLARVLNMQVFILFPYDFTARPSELNPDGVCLESIRRVAF